MPIYVLTLSALEKESAVRHSHISTCFSDNSQAAVVYFQDMLEATFPPSHFYGQYTFVNMAVPFHQIQMAVQDNPAAFGLEKT